MVGSLNVPRDLNERLGAASTPLRARTVVPTSSPEEGRRAPEEFFVPFNIRR